MSGPRPAEDRLRRLLVMLPWLMEAGEVPLADVAARFDLTEAQVTKDLEMVAMCGLPPYVDEMVDVFVDDGVVVVGVPRLFLRPLRLTAPEGFSLLTAGRAAMALPGADPEGPLARGLAKLARALDAAGLDTAPAGGDLADVVVDLGPPVVTELVTEAAAAGRELEVAYYSPARDEVSTRIIVARHVFSDGEHWYVVADDGASGERRTFRLDRFEAVEPTGVVHEVDPTVGAPSAFFDDPGVPRARLRVSPAGAWVADRYPVDGVTPLDDPDGWLEVVLPVGNERWLERLLVRLGRDAELVEPESAAIGARARARRILERYEEPLRS